MRTPLQRKTCKAPLPNPTRLPEIAIGHDRLRRGPVDRLRKGERYKEPIALVA